MTRTLLELEQAFRLSWSAETTCLNAGSLTKWHPANPAYGQCGTTALVVQDLFGGDLLIANVSGGNEEDEVHYWNRFTVGLGIDLTREQFSDYPPIPPHPLPAMGRHLSSSAGENSAGL